MNKTGNVYIKYNPYTVKTIVRFDAHDEHDGEEPKESSPLHGSYLNGAGDRDGKRLQEWIESLPSILEESGREKSYTVTFHGTTLDYEDIRAVVDGSDIISSCEHIQGSDPEDKIGELESLFDDARKLGFDSISGYRDEIDKAFNTGFEAYVVATMSAGKSTLINALLRQKLMPSKNEATTAIVVRIRNTDGKSGFSAYAYGGGSEEPRETIKKLTYEAMTRLNGDENVTNVVIEGKIPFVDAKGVPFVIVDTPGTTSSRNPEHRTRTMKEIESGKQSFIVFLLDATQNGTVSEKVLLEDVAKAMKKGGKMSRDRFLFVINKVDNYHREPENIKKLLRTNRDELAKYGITDARIYPVSAAVALSARIGLANASTMDKAMAETMIEESELHLEQPIEGINSHIPVAAKSGIDKKLADAIGQSDNETQALIHSGVPSLEAAMREYIEKYAKAMRIGEVAEKLKASLDCAAKVAKLNDDITTDKRKREEILAAIDALEAQIESGVQGKTYEEHLSKRIKDALDTVQKKIVELQREISDSVVDYCGVHKEDRLKPSEAESISRDWDEKFRHTESELKNRLSDCLLYGIKSSAEQFLEEYRRSVEIIMPRDEVGALPFDPFSLIGAELTIDSTIDSFTNKEEKSRQIKTGTEKKKNPEREGFLGLFKLNKPWLIDVDVFATEYYTEEYVEWVKYAQDVVGKVRAGIRRYCDEATEQAKANSDNMLADFKNKFNRLNKKLLKKASELREMSKNDETLKERIKKNQKLREDVKQLQARLNDILEI